MCYNKVFILFQSILSTNVVFAHSFEYCTFDGLFLFSHRVFISDKTFIVIGKFNHICLFSLGDKHWE